MTSNLVLQNETAFSKGCVFISLRQELVRRMFNTDDEMGPQHRVKLVNNIIQLLVNSGHKFVYIKFIKLCYLYRSLHVGLIELFLIIGTTWSLKEKFGLKLARNCYCYMVPAAIVLNHCHTVLAYNLVDTAKVH